jgi:hypothetical protein
MKRALIPQILVGAQSKKEFSYAIKVPAALSINTAGILF